MRIMIMRSLVLTLIAANKCRDLAREQKPVCVMCVPPGPPQYFVHGGDIAFSPCTLMFPDAAAQLHMPFAAKGV